MLIVIENITITTGTTEAEKAKQQQQQHHQNLTQIEAETQMNVKEML